MPRLTLFIDDGGVMSDNRVRGPQWQRLLGEFFPPVLGGTSEQWARANRAVIDVTTDDFFESLWHKAGHSIAEFDRLDRLHWLGTMCRLVGVPMPPEPEAVEIARRAAAYVRPRVHAEIPGAGAAIRQMHAMGYKLHTASAEASGDLADYVGTMGVRDCFGPKLYGADLLGVLKTGTEFYTRLFADVGLAPEQALVVDDRPAAVAWAREVGAKAILIGANRRGMPGLTSLAELPAALAQFE